MTFRARAQPERFETDLVSLSHCPSFIVRSLYRDMPIQTVEVEDVSRVRLTPS